MALLQRSYLVWGRCGVLLYLFVGGVKKIKGRGAETGYRTFHSSGELSLNSFIIFQSRKLHPAFVIDQIQSSCVGS